MEDLSQEQVNRFVVNQLADRLLYTRGIDTDVHGLYDMMEEMGIKLVGFQVDEEKFAVALNETLEAAFTATARK